MSGFIPGAPYLEPPTKRRSIMLSTLQTILIRLNDVLAQLSCWVASNFLVGESLPLAFSGQPSQCGGG